MGKLGQLANSGMDYGEVTDALRDSTILLTGATGFVGTAVLFRLLHDQVFIASIKKVLALVRADSIEAAIARLPKSLQVFARPDPAHPEVSPKLVVLKGDCRDATLGLTGDQANMAREANIVIHAAGDTRFKLTLASAIEAIADIAYATGRFSLTSRLVKTHIHISTCYIGWYKEPGSTVYERLSQEDSHESVFNFKFHANSYVQAASVAENCVNALFSAQAGQPFHGKAARILRLTTLGPAAQFPRPGWGVGHPSSPISAGICTEVFDPSQQAPWMPSDATVEILPVDIAVNQIIALVAAVHRTHRLPTHVPGHPSNHGNPLTYHRKDIPCYNIATGLEPFYQTYMATINMRETKISQPFIPEQKLLEYYKPFISKNIHFSTDHTHNVLGIAPYGLKVSLASPWSMSSAIEDGIPHGNVRTEARGRFHHVLHDPSTSELDVSSAWPDPHIDCGRLQIDCPRIVESSWGALGGPNSMGWIGYLKCIRDEMEQNGPNISWDIYVS